jgi:polar amino acid transport system substrate-binding protein
MQRLTVLAVVLFLVAGLAFGGGQEESDGVRTITVGTDATWPPMEFVNADKEIVGKRSPFPRAIRALNTAVV